MQTAPRLASSDSTDSRPGVSRVSATIRDNNDESLFLSNRGNTVAVISDSTRVLGDGNVTPPGGLGVMEGKAMLMKYLGGIDAVALCMDSRNEEGKNDPAKLIEFVKRAQYSFGAVNLEDISQPNCYRVCLTSCVTRAPPLCGTTISRAQRV